MTRSLHVFYLNFLPVFVASINSFNLYPPVNPSKLATAYNITLDCLNALNETIPDCDQDLFSMVGSVDNYWWEEDNVTDICSSNCSTSAAIWSNDVADACDGQYLAAYGKYIPASSVSDRYIEGLNVACMGSETNDTWCLIESQDWVGSDIVRPDCNVNPSDPSCSGNVTDIDPSYQRMANLQVLPAYGLTKTNDQQLCSNCFIRLLYEKITSYYLADADYSDYLVEQLQDIGDVCSTSIPNITLRALPTYDPISSTPTTSSPSSAVPSPTCVGQTLNSISVPAGCDAISTKYGVTTGDLQTLTNSDNCAFSGSICVSSKCDLKQTQSGATCDSFAQGLSGNITTIQFLSWNPNIIGLCDVLSTGQYVCVSPPGGTFSLAPPPLGTSADAGNQQRGGVGGVVTATTTVTSIATDPASEGPGPTATQDGIAKNCNNYAMAKKDDNCVDFSKAHGIAPEQLYLLNPVLGSKGGNCSLQFWASEYYCIGTRVPATPTTTPPPTSSPGDIVTAPGPTQTGIISTCNKYAMAVAGDNCANFAKTNGITTDQLYAWNSVLGANGANCDTQLWAKEYYCIGVKPPNVPVTAPGPTQSGIASNCNKFAQAKSGDSCDAFAKGNGISTGQLYAWNPVLGGSGENCGTALWAKEWYCIGVSG